MTLAEKIRLLERDLDVLEMDLGEKVVAGLQQFSERLETMSPESWQDLKELVDIVRDSNDPDEVARARSTIREILNPGEDGTMEVMDLS